MSINLGRTRSSTNGSQDSLLKSIKQVVETAQFKGDKVDSQAINQILQAIAESQTNAGEYQLALASANNDALVEKLKDVIQKLYDQQATDAEDTTSESTETTAVQEVDSNAIAEAVLKELLANKDKFLSEKDDKSTSSKKDSTQTKTTSAEDNKKTESEDKDTSSAKESTVSSDEIISEIKEQFQESEDDSEFPIVEGKDGNYTNTNIAENFSILQDQMTKQIEALNQKVEIVSQSHQSFIQKSIIDPVSNVFGKISKFTANVATSIAKNIKSFITSAVEGTVKVITAPFKALKSGLTKLGTGIMKGITAPFKALKSGLTKLGTGIMKGITAPFKALGNKIADVKKKLVSGLKNVAKTVGKAMISAIAAPFKLIGGMFSALNPFKQKKKKKKPTKEEIKLSKMIDKVNDFIDNFFDRMLGYVDAFLDRVLKSAKKIVTKLMVHIFAWLLVNVVLIGMLLALIIKFIADPLMKILQPIMDFIAGLINSVLDFLKPIRDFLINILSAAWKIIEVPLKAFFNGIATVAEALGRALGKLVIGIADFFVDTLLPFLRDHLLPVLGAALDVIKEFFIAIKPWIKPLVDTVLSILQTFLEAIKPWIKPLVDTVISALIAIMDVLKRLVLEVGEILIDIAKIIHVPIKIIKDFFEGLGTKAKEIGAKVGDIVLKVLTKIENSLDGIMDTLRLYVVAPLAGLKRWLNSKLITFKNTIWVPTFEWGKPNPSNLTGIGDVIDKLSGMRFFKNYVFLKTKVPFGQVLPNNKLISNPDEGKSVSELVADEMGKMQEKIAAEKEAAKAADLAKKLEMAKIDNLLKNQHAIDDILAYAKANNEALKQISEKMGLETVEVNLKQIEPEVDMSKIEEDSKQQVSEFTQFKTNLTNNLNKLTGIMTENFRLVLEKLDEKPKLLPLPLMNQGQENLTMLESM